MSTSNKQDPTPPSKERDYHQIRVCLKSAGPARLTLPYHVDAISMATVMGTVTLAAHLAVAWRQAAASADRPFTPWSNDRESRKSQRADQAESKILAD